MSRLNLLSFAQKQKEPPANDQQEQFLKDFQDFLKDDKRRVFILRGFAGTGKTYLIKIIYDYFEKTQQKYHIAAPTGRAAKIINDKIGKKVATTIHSLLYSLDGDLDDDDLDDIDKFQLKFNLKYNKDSEYKNVLYIFDEASMISNQTSKESSFLLFGSGNLLVDIFGFTKEVKNSKLLFVGDDAQLPPVDNSKHSPALNSGDLLNLSKLYFYDNANNVEAPKEYSLSEIVRQKQKSGILKASARLREIIENRNFENFNIDDFIKEFANNKDFLTINLDCVTQNFKKLFNKNENEVVYITHTNIGATKFNCDFRRNGRNFSTPLQKGDMLLVVRNCKYMDDEFYNGDFIKVLELLGDDEEHIVNIKGQNQRKLTFVRARIQTEQGEVKELMLLKDYFIYAFNPEILKQDNADDDPLYLREMRKTEQALMVDFRNRFDKEVEAIVKKETKGQDLSQDKFNECKIDKKNSLRSDRMKQDKYLNALRVKFAYAVTCHKAQGGEWENVFIDLNTKHLDKNQDYLRWLYTAITRAKKKVYLVKTN